MPCGHVTACYADDHCTACAREQSIRTAGNDDVETAKRLIAAARLAVANVVPKTTIDWLDGVKHGAAITLAALEEAAPKAARDGR